ncbi:MAG: rhamnogalacturonan acetylesterase [Bacteroidaceae bacterium]|nr:rhamnogalacturonan acetylesterase [Bacteroidaceae bacterium]
MTKSVFLTLAFAALCDGLVAQNAKKESGDIWLDINGVRDLTADSLDIANQARPVPGSSRRGNNPVLFLIGNSTMRTGTRGNGDNGQWGWGYYEHEYFDADKITVENHALGGTSPRTFYKEPNLWRRSLSGVRKGDYVFLELGHNDNGPIDSIRARSSYRPTGKLSIAEDSIIIYNKVKKCMDTVYTFGGYTRRFINEVRALGATPVLFTLTPRNAYEADGVTIQRKLTDFTPAIFAIGKEMNVPVIDLNDISARKLEKYGKWKTDYHFYLDKIHSSAFGAMMNAHSAAYGLDACTDPRLAELKSYLIREKVHPDYEQKMLSWEPANYDKKGRVVPKTKNAEQKAEKPRVFLCGDSTGKNEDKKPDGMWGWGSQGYTVFDESKCTFINAAKAGRSTRTYLVENRWEEVYQSLRPGDYVLIQFGHNDIGGIDRDKERGVISCAKDTSHVYHLKSNGKNLVVYSFGWYLHKMIVDAKEKGAIPVVLSFTPRNEWHEGKGEVRGRFYPVFEKKGRSYIERRSDNYITEWAKQVADENGVEFVDVHNLTADFLDKKCGSKEKAMEYFNHDHTHTSLKGARLNAQSVAKGLRKNKSGLARLLK